MTTPSTPHPQHMNGNTNSIVGAMYKELISKRLSDSTDPLAHIIASMAGIHDLADCCTLASGESADIAEHGSEVGMLAIGSDGREATISIMAKTCTGFGSSNQTSRFWATALLTPAEVNTPAGQAIYAMAGSLDAQSEAIPRATPGHMVAHDFATSGKALQSWLGQADVLERISDKAFGVDELTGVGQKLILVTMRGAGPDGDDLHVLADRVALRAMVVDQAATVLKNQRYVKIGIGAEAIELTPVLRLKRKGGDSGAKTSDQLQTTISPAEIMKAIATKVLDGLVLREEPLEESKALSVLARGDRPELGEMDPHSPMSRLAKRCAREIEGVAQVGNKAPAFMSLDV